jgi:hypothetical protein
MPAFAFSSVTLQRPTSRPVWRSCRATCSIDALRAAFNSIRTLFLLNAVAGDEFTQALIALAWTTDDKLRHPSYKGLRERQDNADVFRLD